MLRVLLLLLAAGVYYAHAEVETAQNPEEKTGKDSPETFRAGGPAAPAPNSVVYQRPVIQPMPYVQQQPEQWYGGNDYYPDAYPSYGAPARGGYYGGGMVSQQPYPAAAFAQPQYQQPYNVLPAAAGFGGERWSPAPLPMPQPSTGMVPVETPAQNPQSTAIPGLTNFDGRTGVTVFDPSQGGAISSGPVMRPHPEHHENTRWVDSGSVSSGWNPQPQVVYGGAPSYGSWAQQPSYYPTQTHQQPVYRPEPTNIYPAAANPGSGFVPGRPAWRRSYTPIPGRSGCFNRCKPRCRMGYGGGIYGCQASCRQTCSLRPNCGQSRPVYSGNTMVCPYANANNAATMWRTQQQLPQMHQQMAQQVPLQTQLQMAQQSPPQQQQGYRYMGTSSLIQREESDSDVETANVVDDATSDGESIEVE